MKPFGRVALCAASLVAAGASPAAAAGAAAPWDFNGDGRRDLAIGVAGENDGAGSIVVMRGTASGLSRNGVKRFSQDTRGVPGVAEAGDNFGATLASGDFDADGYADLAVASPREDTTTDIDVGSVTVLYGGSGGLSATGAHTLGRPDSVFGDPDPEEAVLGFEMVAADFDDDGDRDLAVSVNTGPGGVLVYRGRAAGLATQPFQSIGSGFGLPSELGPINALDAGDIDGNGAPDLVIGFMQHSFARGAVVVVYAEPGSGLDVDGADVPEAQVWTQDTAGVKGVAADLDAFGSAVGIGDVTGDGRRDLVVGVLQQPTDDAEATGALHVLRGSASGVTATGDQYLPYDALVEDPAGALGVELDVGDLDADGVADVAVTHGSMAAHHWGSVLVLYGDADGLGSERSRSFTQASDGVGGTLEPVDYWGDAVRIRDVGGARAADLIVSDQFQDVDGIETGMVTVLWGSRRGVSGSSAKVTQDTPGVPGANEEEDRFGSAV